MAAFDDDWVTDHVTLRDVMLHRTGVGRTYDELWLMKDYDRQHIVRCVYRACTRVLHGSASGKNPAAGPTATFCPAGLPGARVTAVVIPREWAGSKAYSPGPAALPQYRCRLQQ